MYIIKEIYIMGIENLAEAIILQSWEDLWDKNQRKGSVAFFQGEEFKICADIACMKLSDRVRLSGLIHSSTGQEIASARDYRRGNDIEYSVSRR
jgi:hypothetical protein